MQVIWDWAFANDGCVVPDNDSRILIVPGDKVKVFSVRHNTWFDDGVVITTFRNGIRVSYGADTYFGFYRGNIKFIHTSEVATKVIIKGEKRCVVSQES